MEHLGGNVPQSPVGPAAPWRQRLLQGSPRSYSPTPKISGHWVHPGRALAGFAETQRPSSPLGVGMDTTRRQPPSAASAAPSRRGEVGSCLETQ